MCMYLTGNRSEHLLWISHPLVGLWTSLYWLLALVPFYVVVKGWHYDRALANWCPLMSQLRKTYQAHSQLVKLPTSYFSTRSELSFHWLANLGKYESIIVGVCLTHCIGLKASKIEKSESWHYLSLMAQSFSSRVPPCTQPPKKSQFRIAFFLKNASCLIYS